MTKKVDWSAIETEYVTNPKSTSRALGTKYNIPHGTIQTRMRHEKWSEKRKSFHAKVSEKIQSSIVEDLVEQGRKWNQRDIEVFSELRDTAVKALDQIKVHPIIDAKELKAIAGTLINAQRGARLALGLTTENIGTIDPLEEIATPEEIAAGQAILDAKKLKR